MTLRCIQNHLQQLGSEQGSWLLGLLEAEIVRDLMPKELSARQLALDCLSQLDEARTTIGPVIDQAIQRSALSPADRGLFNELVYGGIRWRGQLDWVLRHFVDRRFSLDRRTRNLLRLGVYQLLHLNKIPPHAAVYETVEIAKSKRKAARFINAVLRSVQREADSLLYPSLESHPARHIATSLSYPLWLVKRWIARHGVEWTLAFCRASNQVAPLSLRINTLKTNRADLIQSLAADGATVGGAASPSVAQKWREGESDLAELPVGWTNAGSQIAPDGLLLVDSPPLLSLQAYRDGWFYVQDEGAMLVAHLLRPQTGEKIIDLCAAPGGKTTHIAQLMGNTGEIVAVDRSQGKIRRIAENCQRLSVTNVQTHLADTAVATLDFLQDADTVLIDAPCSGLGTLRRHPDIRWKKRPEQIGELAELQLHMLQNAARQIRSEAVLVYSTCSTEPEENEEVIHRFLETHPHFIVENAGNSLPFVPPNAITPEGFLQTFPHEHSIDGMFAARLKAKAG